jgi:hypothetical protein
MSHQLGGMRPEPLPVGQLTEAITNGVLPVPGLKLPGRFVAARARFASTGIWAAATGKGKEGHRPLSAFPLGG